MPSISTRTDEATHERLLLALDLGNRTWQLGFTVGGGALPPRIRTIAARDLQSLADELRTAKARFGLRDDAPVVSCYEAGRDGFWVYRALTTLGVTNVVVESASIERTRRARQAKSDRLDTTALLAMLGRSCGGERGVWSVVHVPSVDDEDRRQLHRELFCITRERTRVVNRIKALLALHGVVLDTARGLPITLPVFPALAAWDGTPLPPEAQARLTREWHRLTFLRGELRTLLTARRALPRTGADSVVPMVQRLLALRGIGEVGAWIYTTEFFAWRQFRNRRRVGAAAGLCSTLRESGDVRREQGMSKAGNRYLRALAIELAWSWPRRQPQSALSRWYRVRFAAGGSRVRRIGIVALARKLLIALWRYLETGVLPEGAQCKA
jgi:transposase